MGLSGRKIKQRIPQDPRNLSWADDASRFGSTYLSKLGFDHTDKNATLGISGVGLTQHLKVHHKLDMLGIGAQHTKDPNGIAWKQNQDFENLLKRLNANSENPTEDKADAAPIDGFRPAHVDDPVSDVPAAVGSETEGGSGERNVEKERKHKKRKRPRDDHEVADTMERTPKKQKKPELTSAVPATEPVETCPSSSKSPTLKTVATTRKPHQYGRAHRARFTASKRLAATSPVAIAEILGISSSPVTPLSVSGITTPEVTTQVEDGEHEHLRVSSKSVADYFKEKMRLTVLKPPVSGTVVDEASGGGIRSRLKFCGHNGIEEDGGLRDGLGMRLLAKMSAAETVTGNSKQEETPEGEEKEREKGKRQSGDGKGETSRKPKRGHKKAQKVSD